MKKKIGPIIAIILTIIIIIIGYKLGKNAANGYTKENMKAYQINSNS